MGFEDEVEQSWGGFAVRTTVGPSVVPRGTSFHRSVELEFLLSHLIPRRFHAAATSRVQRDARNSRENERQERREVKPAEVAELGLASSVRPPGPSSDPFDEVDGVRPRRVFPNEVFSFEELNESATSARWTASRRRKSEV